MVPALQTDEQYQLSTYGGISTYLPTYLPTSVLPPAQVCASFPTYRVTAAFCTCFRGCLPLAFFFSSFEFQTLGRPAARRIPT